MIHDNHIVTGSIIGLKKEFEEQYIILHKHTFPGVLDRIHRSNISDYSIFMHNGLLFSHMVYIGPNLDTDMKAMGTDATTREWWKLTDQMQQPFEDRKSDEWWTAIDLWYNYEALVDTGAKINRQAYIVRANVNLPKKFPADYFATDSFSETTHGLKTLRVFKGIHDVYIYLETAETAETSDHASLPGIIAGLLKTNEAFVAMTEVFHTEYKNSTTLKPKKVFVTGCFDLLHSGHIAFLQEASTFGELYVSIGSDENVYHLKGRYPVNSQDERRYMINALACVKKCMVNSGWGYIDFESELREVMPDVFVVNEDGHTPSKQLLCMELGIEYHILKRLPYAGLPARSTTRLRTECTIPYRIDLAGGWLDQPYVSKHYAGSVLTISIEPSIEFNDRSGMSSSTRRKAIELWHNEIPHGDTEHLAKMLFSFENPPGTRHVSGSQDSLGIVLPGLNKLDYDNGYWPIKITSEHDEDILCWLENSLYLVTLGPRVNSYSPLENTRISIEGARALSEAAENCWNAILKSDIRAFGEAFTQSFDAQVAMFPNMVDPYIMRTINQYKDIALGWKLSGAGGGGYIILVADKPVAGAMQIRIRRKNSL